MSHRLIGYITLFFVSSFFLFVVLSHIIEKNKYVIRTAYAADIGNLKIENPIKINGITVGYVATIGRDKGLARITVKLHKETIIRSDYRLLNKDVSLTGDRELSLFPGHSREIVEVDSPLFITFVPGIAEGISGAELLGDLVKELRDLVSYYSQVDPSNDTLFTTQIKSVLKEMDGLSLKADRLLVENEAVVKRLVLKGEELTRSVKDISTAVKPQAEAFLDASGNLSRQAATIIDNFEPIINDLEALLTKLEDNDNRLVRLMTSQGGEYEAIEKSIKRLRSLIELASEEGIGLDIDIF